MALKCDIDELTLHFKEPAGTSRGVYTRRRIWLVRVSDGLNTGIGECAPLPDLSCDYVDDYTARLRRFCDRVEAEGEIPYDAMLAYPSMLFGLETAMLSMQRGSNVLYDTPFGRGEEGIPINGLIWMGTYEEMSRRIRAKLEAGFHCVKLKIGAIDFESEISLLDKIRRQYSRDVIELRVDANGAFTPAEALDKLHRLAKYDIHSIEQPIRQGQIAEMARLCQLSPIPIALDEELIGVNHPDDKKKLLEAIRPQFIILKPSLHGGIAGTRQWVTLAAGLGIGSWITSALESNIGLNAVAHVAADLYGPNITMPQGLGTGRLFIDNIPMPLAIKGEKLWIK